MKAVLLFAAVTAAGIAVTLPLHAVELRRGVIQRTLSPHCTIFACDNLTLEPDSGYQGTPLEGELLTSALVGMHVEIAGFQGRCDTCNTFHVITLVVLGVDPFKDLLGIPSTVELRQNFPNPFNPTTTIDYTLPVEGDVRLHIFNTLGEEVAALVTARQSPGRHSLRWDATGRPSGVYFYRLYFTTPNGLRMIEIRKMLLLG